MVGWKNSGKTTLVERLIPLLARRGLKVATVKHTHHDLRPPDGATDGERHARRRRDQDYRLGADGLGDRRTTARRTRRRPSATSPLTWPRRTRHLSKASRARPYQRSRCGAELRRRRSRWPRTIAMSSPSPPITRPRPPAGRCSISTTPTASPPSSRPAPGEPAGTLYPRRPPLATDITDCEDQQDKGDGEPQRPMRFEGPGDLRLQRVLGYRRPAARPGRRWWPRSTAPAARPHRRCRHRRERQATLLCL